MLANISIAASIIWEGSKRVGSGKSFIKNVSNMTIEFLKYPEESIKDILKRNIYL